MTLKAPAAATPGPADLLLNPAARAAADPAAVCWLEGLLLHGERAAGGLGQETGSGTGGLEPAGRTAAG